MSAFLDDLLGHLAGRQRPGVHQAVLGDHHIHGMLAVIHVRHHGDDGRNIPVLGRAGRHDKREGTVAQKIAGAADAVHQLGTGYVGGIDMAVDIHLDGRIDGDHSQTADHLGAVGNLHRPQDDLLLVAIELFEKAHPRPVGKGHGRSGGRPDLAHVDQVQNSVLQNLGINIQILVKVIFHEPAQHGIGHIPHPGLPGQIRRHPVFADFMPHEIQDVGGHAACPRVRFREDGTAVLGVAEDDGHHPVRIHFDERFSDPVAGAVDRNRHPVRGVFRDVDVVDALQMGGLR